jgi:deoxyribodipyrimidine photo-lyase
MNLWQPNWPVAGYLARELADYHPAVHHVIHQLAAGMTSFSGLMVYDVVKQGVEHDRNGDFIRRWLPELADLPGSAVHEASMTAGHLSDIARAQGYEPYPAPIVDHKATGKLAKENIHAIRQGLPLKTAEPEPQQSLF